MELLTLRRLGNQHAGLLARCGSVESSLETLIATAARGEEDEGAYTRLVSLLTALRRELAEHMALEEEGGFLASAVSAAPRLSRPAARLAAEHATLPRRLDGILDCVLSALHAPREWPAIGRAFGRFSAMLLEHERVEDELVRAAYLDDLGEGD